MGTWCKKQFYSRIPTGFSNTFHRGTLCVFHFKVLMIAEECEVHCGHLERRWLILYSTLTLPRCGYYAVIHSEVLLQVPAGA